MSRTLFEIGADERALLELLEDVGGEITDAQAEAAIDSFFAELGAERNQKLDSYCALIREFEAKQSARADEAGRLLALAQTDGNNAKRLKSRLMSYLQTSGEMKIETARFKIARTANGGKQPVEIDEWAKLHPEELSEKFRLVYFAPDLNRIGEALKAGEELEFARFGERGEHLRIR